jgi:hypothetical protein
MKVSIKIWAGEGAGTLLKAVGLADLQEIPEDSTFDVMRKLFYYGLNVMLWRKDQDNAVLFVDTKRFTQR